MVQISPSPSRPNSIKILNVFYVVLSILSILRVVQAITQWNYLIELHVSPHPFYFLISGFLWSISNGINTVGLFFRKPWITSYTKINGIFICLWLWFEYLFLTQPGNRTNLPFLILISVIWVGYILLIFRIPKVRHYFGIGQSKNA